MPKLEEITLKIASGSTPKGGKESYKTEGISLVRSLNVHDFNFLYKDLAFIDYEQSKKLSNVIIEENDILLNITGASVGRCTMIPVNVLPARVNQHVMIIRPNTKLVNPQFLLYLINSTYYKSKLMLLSETGATREALTKEDISSFNVKLPDLDIQNKIATLLSNYDKLIQNNTKRIKLLEEMAEEIYKEWFVRLRFPDYENSNIVDGVPSGWKKKNLFEISDVIYGYPLQSSLFNENKIGEPLVRIRDINTSSVKTFTTERISDEKYYLKNGDLIVGMDGDFHFGKWSGGKAILNQRVVCFRPLKNISKYLFYCSLKRDIEYLNYVISGTTVAHLSDKDLKKITVLIPTQNIMNDFKEKIDQLYDLEITLKLKNQTLKETRDLLLPRVMSGKLDLENLEIV